VTWLVSAVVAFTAAVLLHAAVVRVACRTNRVLGFLAAGGVTALALVAWELAATTHRPLEILTALAVYALACELYIFVFTLVASSVSVAVLLALDPSPLSEDAIGQRYSARSMVEARIDGLVSAGCLDVKDGQCVLTARGRTLVTTFERLRRLFGHDDDDSPSLVT
jgi:hypothetical protein